MPTSTRAAKRQTVRINEVIPPRSFLHGSMRASTPTKLLRFSVGDDAHIVPRADEGIRPYDEASNPRTAKSFFVPKEEIVENGYDLSINKYKKTEYVAVEYPSTAEILADLHELEMQITAGLAELEGMI